MAQTMQTPSLANATQFATPEPMEPAKPLAKTRSIPDGSRADFASASTLAETPYGSTADLSKLGSEEYRLVPGQQVVVKADGTYESIVYDAEDRNPQDEAYVGAAAPKFLETAYAGVAGVLDEPVAGCDMDLAWRSSNTVACDDTARRAAHNAGARQLSASKEAMDCFGCDCMEYEVIGDLTSENNSRYPGYSVPAKPAFMTASFLPEVKPIYGRKFDAVYGRAAYETKSGAAECDFEGAWRWSNTKVTNPELRNKAHAQLQTVHMMAQTEDDFGCDEVEFEVYGK